MIKLFEDFKDKEIIKKEIMDIFRTFKKIFPFMRPDTIDRKVDKDEYIYEDGVVILFTVYKHIQKISDKINAYGNDVMLNEIVNKDPGNGKTSKIFYKFIDKMKNEGHNRILLTVREDNDRAIEFYKRKGFEEVDTKSWAGGSVPGFVFEYIIK